MIHLQSEEFLHKTIESFMIEADKVAHVQIGNNLEHALLVLTKTGYSAIPVLDPQYRLYGLIGTNMIMETIIGLKRIEYEKLDQIPVEQAMKTDIPRLKVNDPLLKGLGMVVDHTFVCVESEDRLFEGIFTRRVILKQLNKHIRTSKK